MNVIVGFGSTEVATVALRSGIKLGKDEAQRAMLEQLPTEGST